MEQVAAMKFTGERYMPNLNWPEISYEHWHRYLYAVEFVAGKSVLDIACGEGYGSNLLADVAKNVVGVDSDPDTVKYASSKYLRSNLEFHCGIAEAIPIQGTHIFDVVVSFETIEHLTEGGQLKFGNEVKRLLKPGGVLLISTPDKLSYSDKLNYSNEYHQKEFYQEEFADWLRSFFGVVHLLGQRVYPVSYIWPLNEPLQRSSEYQLDYINGHFEPLSADRKDGLYLLAVCSDREIEVPGGSVLVDVAERAIRQRIEQVAEKEQVVQTFSAQVAEQDQAVRWLREELEARDAQLACLNQEYQAEVARLNQEHQAEVACLNQEHQAEVARLNQELNTLYSSRTWRIASKGLRIYQLAKAIGKRLVVSASQLSKRPLAANVKPASTEQVTANAPPKSQGEAFSANHLRQSKNLTLKVLFISHDAHLYGAPIVLLNLLKWFKANSDIPFEILLKDGNGELGPEFEALAPVTVWNASVPVESSLPRRVISRLLQATPKQVRAASPAVQSGHVHTDRIKEHFSQANIGLIYSNTITNGEILAALSNLHCPVISHVHELEYWMNYRVEPENLKQVQKYTHHYVVVSQAVKQSLVENLKIPEDKIDVVYGFILTQPSLSQAQDQIRQQLNIPQEALVVGACGTMDWRKGPDLFIQLARTIHQRQLEKPVHFIWVGGESEGPDFSALWHDVKRAGLEEYIHFVGKRPNPLDYFATFDVFALVSREDPFPLVSLEAASLGKPIVCFDGAGGAKEFVGDDCGFVVPYLDIETMAARVIELLNSPELRQRLGQQAAEKVRQQHDVAVVAPKILSIIQQFLLNGILKQAPTVTSPKELFGNLSDDFWFWLHTEGYRKSLRLRNILPTLPEETVQLRFTGVAGDATLRDAFSAYTLFKQIAQNHLEDSKLNAVLDFGCGWGRIIRFFLKDIEPSNLWGIDCFPEVIEICKQTNKWCNFELIDPFPPTSFPDDTFDLIYCYSIFSHLSEDIHRKWLVEFRRILRPGGLLIATTWPREFIMMCAELRKQENRPVWRSGPAKSFLDTAQALSDYDSGKYLHSPVGGGGVLDPSFFGETCIPKGYVLSHWTKHFKFLDFIDDRNLCPQNVIVVKK